MDLAGLANLHNFANMRWQRPHATVQPGTHIKAGAGLQPFIGGNHPVVIRVGRHVTVTTDTSGQQIAVAPGRHHQLDSVDFRLPQHHTRQRPPLRGSKLPVALQAADHANAKAVGIEVLGVRPDLVNVAPGEDLTAQVDNKVVANGAQRRIDLCAGRVAALETALGVPGIDDLCAGAVAQLAGHAALQRFTVGRG